MAGVQPIAEFAPTCYDQLPDTGTVPLVADMSSDILSKIYRVEDFGLIYGGAQKNIGPAGLTLVIVRKDLLGHAMDITPVMLNYQVQAEKGSMFNTPPTFAIYLAGLVFDWAIGLGGLSAIEARNVIHGTHLINYVRRQSGPAENYPFGFPVKKLPPAEPAIAQAITDEHDPNYNAP